MATLKLTLDKRRKYQDGRSPVIIRLTQNGKSTSIPTGVKVHFSDWDSDKLRIRKHPNKQDLNLALTHKLLDYEQKLIELEATKGTTLGLIEMKQFLVNGNHQSRIRFQDFVLEEVRHLQKQGRYGNAQSYLTASNRVVDFAGSSLTMDSINYEFVQKLESFLIDSGVGINGVAAYMRAIRAIVNKAGRLGKYDLTNYPFRHYKIRTHKTVSRAEPIEVIRSIANYELPIGSEMFHARNTFLLIFGLIGISFIDLITLKKTDLKGNRIIYKRRKTGKLYSIKVTPLVDGILNYYHRHGSGYLLPQFGVDGAPESKIRHVTNLGLKKTNRYLKQLGNELGVASTLTTYVARYSWANIAKGIGYSNDLIAEALGHNYGNPVTGIYLDSFGSEIIDNANATIMSMMLTSTTIYGTNFRVTNQK